LQLTEINFSVCSAAKQTLYQLTRPSNETYQGTVITRLGEGQVVRLFLHNREKDLYLINSICLNSPFPRNCLIKATSLLNQLVI